jgi:hypothetical protein
MFANVLLPESAQSVPAMVSVSKLRKSSSSLPAPVNITLSSPAPPSMSPVISEPVPRVSESSPALRLIAASVLLTITP